MMTQEEKKIKASQIVSHVLIECGNDDELIDMIIKSLGAK